MKRKVNLSNMPQRTLAIVTWLCLSCSVPLANAVASTRDVASAASLHQPISPAENEDRELAVYAVYNIPPFAVTFQTERSASVDEAISMSSQTTGNGMLLLSETDGTDSSLSFPIRDITERFLMEQLQAKIQNAPRDSPDWFPIYQHLSGVDSPTQLFLKDGAKEVETLNSSLRRNQRHLRDSVTLIAEFRPSVAFSEPNDDASIKPSNEEVRAQFGDWLQTIFKQNRDEYLRELVQSDQDLLTEIFSLEITTDLTLDGDGKSVYASGWSERTQKALLTILILLGIVGVAWLFVFIHHRHKHSLVYESDDQFDDQVDALRFDMGPSAPSRPPSLRLPGRAASLDALRHGTDTFYRSSLSAASQAMDATDRYLSKHRPDLYQDDDQNISQINIFGRQYTIPANPFDSIYQKTFVADRQQPQPISNTKTEPIGSPSGAFTSPTLRRISSLEVQRQNIAASKTFEPSPADDEYHFEHIDENGVYHDENNVMGGRHWSDGGGYRPISSIWRNISTAWQDVTGGAKPSTGADGLACYSDEIELQEHRVDYPEDEVEEYDFAFKDFPRQDGTPCLIFNDQALQGEQHRIFTIGANDDDEDELFTRDKMPVSDEAFQRMLAQHNATMNDSFDEVNFEVDDDPSITSTAVASDLPAKSPEFKAKLTYLMETKYRRYEQKTIIENHQKKRARERKQVRDQERRERHKAMEKDIEEIEAAFSSPIERVRYSPKPARYEAYAQSPQRVSAPSPSRASQYSPKIQQRFHQAFSPFRNSSPAAARRSPQQEDDLQSVPALRHNSRTASPYRAGASAPYRPAPKTIFNDIIKSESEDDDDLMYRQQPRLSHPYDFNLGGPDDLFVDTPEDTYSHPVDLEKLSMPPMHGMSAPQQLAPKVSSTQTGKYPSPQSVTDELLLHASSPGRKPQSYNIHRRVNSSDAKVVASARPPSTGRPSRGTASSSKEVDPSHRRSSSNSSHRRTNSNNSKNLKSKGNKKTHKKTKSNSDDVYLHGIFAQTRFV